MPRRWVARAHVRALAAVLAAAAAACGGLLAGRVAWAAGEDVTATVDARPAVATVGDRIGLHVQVTHPPGWTVVWPDPGMTWEPFEVVSVGPSVVGAAGGDERSPDSAPGDASERPASATVTNTRIFTVTAFITGTLLTPALSLTAVDTAGAAHRVEIAGVSVAIRSVLGAQDTAPRSARGPVELPMPAVWPLVVGALAAVTALLTVLGWALRRMWARRVQPVVETARLLDFSTPLDHALAALDDLRRANLPGRGRAIEHYTRLADALRTFVEGAYHLPALERTTRELAHAFGPSADRDAEVAPLLAVLGDADLVKFAGIVPDTATALASLADAKALLGPLWSAAERRRIAAEAAAAAASHWQPDEPTADLDDPTAPAVTPPAVTPPSGVAEPGDADDEAAA